MDPPKTPPRPTSLPQVGTTPQRAKHTNHDGHQSSKLEDARSDIVRDAGRIPVVPVEEFRKFILPVVKLGPAEQTLDDDLIERIRATCIEEKFFVREKGQMLWERFPLEPYKMDDKEDKAFQSFRNLWVDVIGLVETKYSHPQKSIVRIECRPSKAQDSERPASSHPDSVAELIETTTVTDASPQNPKWYWENTTTAMEFKKRDPDKEGAFIDDAGKVIFSGTHILRNDPCRRFTFGITVENTEMRVWHFSRSGIIMTEPINWMEDHTTVIHVFTSLAFATKTDLGYDPTMRRVLVGEVIEYETTMQDGETYVTDGPPLFDFRADAAEGRATRVWKVYKKGGDRNDCFVLKDSWMFSNSKSEGDIMRDLMGKIDEKDRHYFLTVVSDGAVCVDGIPDQTEGTIMRGIPTITKHEATQAPRIYEEPKAKIKGSQRNESRGRPPGIKEEYSIDLHEAVITPRTHYRILFREVCKPLHDLRDLGVVLALLVETAKALRILHKNQIVHGDLSTGNILFYNGKLKLADLEYSRKIDQERQHSFRTGTLEFMSIDVEAGQYSFVPVQTTILATSRSQASKSKTKPFRYGMIHDLESLWWIAVWFLFHTQPLGTQYKPEVFKTAGTLFSRQHNRKARDRMLLVLPAWESSVQDLPAEFSQLADQLGEFRAHYIHMAQNTYKSLTPEGIAYEISTKHLKDEGQQLDAYDVVEFFFHSDPLLVELITTKRKDAPETEPAEPAKVSGPKRVRRQ